MQAFWVSLKESVNCGSKLTVMAIRPDKCSERGSWNPEKEKWNREIIHQMRNSFREVIIRPNHMRTLFCELNIGDPARNITEMIFQRASKNNPSRKITRVFKVKNSAEILDRFERYRERVKKSAYEQHKRHPRSTVDGNELLRFYGTTMSCCSETSKRVHQLCRDPGCQVCRILQSNFDTEYTRRNGIQLNTNSEELSDKMIAISKMKKMQRAVIVCRIIAGTVVDKVDKVCKECDSQGCEGQDFSSESLVVRNPCAVLPCFVIVFT